MGSSWCARQGELSSSQPTAQETHVVMMNIPTVSLCSLARLGGGNIPCCLRVARVRQFASKNSHFSPHALNV